MGGWPALLLRVMAHRQAETPVPSCGKAVLLRILINTVVLPAPRCQRREVHVPGRGTAALVMPIQRIEMAIQDMDVIAELMNERFAEHRARFCCDDPARVDAGVRTVTVGPLDAALVRLRGFRYQAEISPPDAFLALVLLAGTGTMAFGQDQVSLARGDVMLDAIDLQRTADMHDSVVALVRLPRPVAAELAEEHTGLPATDLRFESITPVSATAGTQWARTALFICR